MFVRVLTLLCAVAVFAAFLAPDARAARRDTEICEKLLRGYIDGNALVTEYGVTAELDPQIALLRQIYVNTLMVRQGIVLDYLRWYGCKLPDDPLPPVPELNLQQFVEMANASIPGEDVAVVNDRRLKVNRVRILDLLRDAAAINALPAACAGSASFAAHDIQQLFDRLYEVGYGTEDVYYFQSQYDDSFKSQYDVVRTSIRQSGFDATCNRDMTAETRTAFDKLESIRALFR
ncbi:MAG: hypothetical protein HOH66_05380 [Rhodospirillaceae bacterium]|nr:hypothetical protein [Rhodospirillaceae bacterium]MBT6117278.1 hypothetical protein [Rhodospirillaceae bacterium]